MGSINENFKRFKNLSINYGRHVVNTGRIADTGTLRQTELYRGYSGTLRPAATAVRTAADVMSVMSAIQLSRDYKRFNKEYGEEIQKFIQSQNSIKVGDWNKRTLFTSRMQNNINIAVTHSKTKLAKDGTIHCYKHNPEKAVRQVKQLEREFYRRKDVANIDIGALSKKTLGQGLQKNAVVRRLHLEKLTGQLNISYAKDAKGRVHLGYDRFVKKRTKSEEKLYDELLKRLDRHSAKRDKYARINVKAKEMHEKMQAARARTFKNYVPKHYDSTKLSAYMRKRIRTEEHILRNAGKKVKGVRMKKDVDLKDGDLLIQIAGKKAMAAKGARNKARGRSLRSFYRMQMSFMRSAGMTKDNDFGQGYLVMQKAKLITKPLVNRMTISVIKKALIKSGKISLRIAKKIGLEAVVTGVHAYRSYKLSKSGAKVAAKDLKTAIESFRKNQKVARIQSKRFFRNKIIRPVKKYREAVIRKITVWLTKPFQKFILKWLNRINNSVFSRIINGVGKAIGKVIGFALKPLLALFRGLTAVFSAISSFIFSTAFIYAMLFAGVMAAGSLLSGVFGIFDSIGNAISEAWSNTDPNVNYAVEEIQDASKELSGYAKTMEDLAVLSSLLDNLPISQFWRLLTNQEIEVCAGYEIIVDDASKICILEIPAADDTVDIHKIDIKMQGDKIQENDREILSIVSNLYEYYGGISNDFNIGKQIEKARWRKLVQQLYVLSHDTSMEKEYFTVEDYSVNYWTGEKTVTGTTTYYKWKIYVKIMRGTEFFNKCGEVALEAGKEIDPDIEVTTQEELLEYYIASMEKDELWDEDSDICYKEYEYTYFDASESLLANIADNFTVTPSSQYTYDYSNPPDNIYIIDSSDDNNSVEYVRIIQKDDGTYDTTGASFVASNGSVHLGSVFHPDKNGNPNQTEQEYISKYLEEKGIEVNENTSGS